MRSLCLLCLSVFAAACTQSTDVTRDGSLSTKDGSAGHDGAALDAKVRDDAATPDLCRLPPDPGNCLAYVERYAFNPKTHACELFV